MDSPNSAVDAPPQGVLPIRRTSDPSWFERNWKWFVPVLIVGLVSCFALFLLGVFSIVDMMLRSSYPYQFAIQQANKSDLVAAKIGRPFSVGWFKTGRINLSGATGDADIEIPISGAKGRGKIFVVAKKQAGRWVFETLELIVDGENDPIPLLDSNPAPTSSPQLPGSLRSASPPAQPLQAANRHAQ